MIQLRWSYLHFKSILFYIYFSVAILITSQATDEVDPAAKEVIMRGSDTSVLIRREAGKISTVHFEQDDDDDDSADGDDKEDFGDDNEEVLSFQVESLQEVNSQGRSAQCRALAATMAMTTKNSQNQFAFMSSTMALRVRCTIWYISLLFSTKQQREMTKCSSGEREHTYDSEFSFLM